MYHTMAGPGPGSGVVLVTNDLDPGMAGSGSGSGPVIKDADRIWKMKPTLVPQYTIRL